jgi:hypothetical protein
VPRRLGNDVYKGICLLLSVHDFPFFFTGFVHLLISTSTGPGLRASKRVLIRPLHRGEIMWYDLVIPFSINFFVYRRYWRSSHHSFSFDICVFGRLKLCNRCCDSLNEPLLLSEVLRQMVWLCNPVSGLAVIDGSWLC